MNAPQHHWRNSNEARAERAAGVRAPRPLAAAGPPAARTSAPKAPRVPKAVAAPDAAPKPKRASPPDSASWPPERLELLEILWMRGDTGSQIAKALGGDLSRCAVIGKVKRMGWVRTTAAKPARAAPAKSREVCGAPVLPPATKLHPAGNRVYLVSEDRPIPKPTGELSPTCADTLGLAAHMCKWPIGDPKREGFGFCGRESDDGPYCRPHAIRAVIPGSAIQGTRPRTSMRRA